MPTIKYPIKNQNPSNLKNSTGFQTRRWRAGNFQFSKSKSEGGFTLVELLVGLFAFVVLSLGVISLISGLLTSSNKQASLLSDSDQARKAVFTLVNELRNAQTANTGAFALDTAGDQQIIFYSNVDGGADIERVRYFLQNGKVVKGIVKYSGGTYPLGSEQTFNVQSNIANGGSPLFYYYDGSYRGSSTQASLIQPVNVTAVKYVKARLDIFNKAGVANTNYYSVIIGGSVRNLKTNLGQ